MSKTVLISHEMLGGLQGRLEAEGYEVVRRWDMSLEQAGRVEAIVHVGENHLTHEFLKFLPALKLIANVSVGYDGVDVPWCTEHGIAVTHAEGLNAEDVADVAMGLMIGAWRNLLAGDAQLRAGKWSQESRMRPPRGLRGLKMGIMGLGHIGQAVAVRAEAFGMEVAWWGPNPKPDAKWPRAETLLQLAQDSDILVVACKADVSNRQAVSAQVIDAVGPDGMIVNVARGSVIDEDALIDALKAGRLGRAGLDVFAVEPTPPERWADVPNTFLTPHTAGGTTNSLPLMIGQCFENLRLHFAGEPLSSPVYS
ncbi:MAG: hydroxyacid dehydrogenase [Alphaproteobacteria bacterium PA2]|nr:MAG: hydroxyacid dehydrogenase [Alphaproteobacteria bacterium PA2]